MFLSFAGTRVGYKILINVLLNLKVQLSESPLGKLNLPGIAFSCCLSHARLENQAEALESMKTALSR